MISMSDVLMDLDFAQAYTITRSSGVFALGGYQSAPASVPAFGPVMVAAEEDLAQLPEGDRKTGAMAFYWTQPIYASRGGTAQGVSDVIAWNGETYRVAKVWPYLSFGFYKAVGVRMAGE